MGQVSTTMGQRLRLRVGFPWLQMCFQIQFTERDIIEEGRVFVLCNCVPIFKYTICPTCQLVTLLCEAVKSIYEDKGWCF